MGLLDIRAPTSLRLAMTAAGESLDPASMTAPSPLVFFQQQPEESHPPFNNLVLLVFGAVLQVVCVSLPGYIIARAGGFNADQQRFLANLNVSLFTPCLSKAFSAGPVVGSTLTVSQFLPSSPRS
jgi:auxin efflux carrier family protein